ncbi:hypothetical protein A1O3_04057 [Capronia epimyces CBS 606.96]|uniref:C2H2-type domain-containing protein n=1 Tax=Capronia epimyces CBS 606.96 TaxID=1182542 RepID=W9YXS5_9EURO|nr:uncharacterized protein A1O3_04057 [Capronia epimyces CBS 606.96]EXJ87099.1 hypothetical protein A1O3_04057 [Capronia epimyces CBS 606.96]
MAQIDSDDDFDLDDYEMVKSEDEDEASAPIDDTPASTPPSSTLPPCRRKTLKCHWDNCDKTFNRQARLAEHIRSHTNTRPFTCPHSPCTKAFLRASHLKHHVKSAHTDVRDYKCTWAGCDASFATGTRLRRHVQAHEIKEKFRCHGYPGCEQTFRKQETLDRHILSVHRNIKPFPCTELDSVTGLPCTKAYDTAENLRTHQRAKHDPTRFSCSDCMARNAAALANPTEGGSDDLVKASFATYGELQAHIAEEHPPMCSFCPTSFITNKELTRHLELQHGVLSNRASETTSNFPCTYPNCSKKFSKKGNLNVHIKTVHENQRDFICGQTEITLPEELTSQQEVVVYGCNRSFTSKASLEEHVRTAHLGLESKRSIREKKRKAEQDVDDFEAVGFPWLGQAFKKRKPRSDKGVKKSSDMARLTGVPANHGGDGASSPKQAVAGLGSEPVTQVDEELDDSLLSGSMTMCGSQIFHYDSCYHYPSGEYPTVDGSATELSKPRDEDAEADFHFDFGLGQNTPPGTMDYEVDDNFFGHFEQEHSAFAYPPPFAQ